MMNVDKVETLYVRDVYERLADIKQESVPSWKSNRPWPRVREFMRENLPVGSLLIDVGCGPVKHHTNGTFSIGFDTCGEALLKAKRNSYQDQVLADGLHLPFR